ncbi:hypothetical protein [Rhodococcus chondri]|uniref:Uncharacterized protein n=1 Tax=Rhodococcus chondri TaxID=3065941 RepID=A0ABU7JMJ8_9NOCA|nr:hypothetical protein [Rhodococcus sp. CC-R104]MEE2031089.1 hypothetical protein [Rhodococcus sp. CC-R104]
MRHRTRALAGLAFTAAVALGAPATASSETLPTDVPTIAMTVENDSDAPMVFDTHSNPYGRWVDEPATVVPAHTTQQVTAASSDRRGFGVQVSYTMPGDASVVLMANNHGTGVANADGTRIDGANRHGYTVDARVDDSYPYMNVTFTVARP